MPDTRIISFVVIFLPRDEIQKPPLSARDLDRVRAMSTPYVRKDLLQPTSIATGVFLGSTLWSLKTFLYTVNANSLLLLFAGNRPGTSSEVSGSKTDVNDLAPCDFGHLNGRLYESSLTATMKRRLRS